MDLQMYWDIFDLGASTIPNELEIGAGLSEASDRLYSSVTDKCLVLRGIAAIPGAKKNQHKCS